MLKTIDIHCRIESDGYGFSIRGDWERGPVKRDEGGHEIRLVDPDLKLQIPNHGGAWLHPDISALIGVLAYFPVLPKEPFQLKINGQGVSAALAASLRKPYILPNLILDRDERATDCLIPRVSHVVSYGGGIDSLAAHLLFPNAKLIHETPLDDENNSYSDVVNEILPSLTDNYALVHTNLRRMYDVWGLPVWVSVYISSLLFQPRYIISGSELTGTYLLGGKRWHPRFENRWYSVFKACGVSILPTSFLSEYGNAKICAANGKLQYAAYCMRISVRDCGKCTKCLRRRLLREACGESGLIDGFIRSDAIDQFVTSRPLYYGDIFSYAASQVKQGNWLTEKLADIFDPGLEFHGSYYAKAFDDFEFPEDLRRDAECGMADAGLQSMTEEHVSSMMAFKQM